MKKPRRPNTHRPVRKPPRVSGPAHAPVSRVPRKWRWHYRVLQGLRDHLLDELTEQRSEASESSEPHIANPADQASDETYRLFAVSLLSGEQNAMYEIESALRRILSGGYGICEKTGKPIETERLRAVPWTRFSRDAQAELEMAGAFPPIEVPKVESIQGPGPGGLAQVEEPDTEESQEPVEVRHKVGEALSEMEARDREKEAE